MTPSLSSSGSRSMRTVLESSCTRSAERSSRGPISTRSEAGSPLHLKLDEPVHLDGVFHRKLLRDRLDEAVHDHRGRLRLGNPAAHEIEDLLVTDLRDGRLVSDRDLILLDFHVRIRIRPRVLVEQERVATHRGLAPLGALRDLDEPAVA